MKTRRSFLRDAAIAGAGGLIMPGLTKFRNTSPKLKNVGVQLYSVRKEMLSDASGTLNKLGEIGYQEIESAQSEKGNYYGLAPKEIKKILKDQGMTLRSGHTHIDNNWQKSIDEAAEAGRNILFAPYFLRPDKRLKIIRKAPTFLTGLENNVKKVLSYLDTIIMRLNLKR